MEFTIDANGLMTQYRDDGKTRDYTKDQGCYEVHYGDDGNTVAYTKNRDGYEMHYCDDGMTLAYIKDKDGYETHYRADGKSVEYIADTQSGYEVHFYENGKIEYILDNQGNETHYGADGVTIAYTKNKDNDEVHYADNGVTVKSKDEEIVFNGNNVAQMSLKDGIKVVYNDAGNISTITDTEGYTVHYKEGKADYLEDSEGNKVSKRLFGQHKMKEVIVGAEDIKLLAENKRTEWQNTSLLADSAKIQDVTKEIAKTIQREDLPTRMREDREQYDIAITKVKGLLSELINSNTERNEMNQYPNLLTMSRSRGGNTL